MPILLNTLLSRWESEPPVFLASETSGWDDEFWSLIEKHQILRELTPVGFANCSDCSRQCEVEYIQAADGKMRGYLHCDECGLEEVFSDRLRRWEIDSEAMLRAVFSELKLSMEMKSPGCLWRIGRATWAGHSRHVWFVRRTPTGRDGAVEILRKNPKAIVFAPTTEGASLWKKVAGCFSIPLDEVCTLDTRGPSLKVEDIEERIIDAWSSADGAKKPKRKRRASRLAAIEKLEKELIQHIQDAKDHAYAIKDLTGTPALLRRPTQKELAAQLKMDESLVSRCLDEKESPNLRYLWDLAADLDRILGYVETFSEGDAT